MSRSYKHTPYCGISKDKFYKHYANRKVRRLPLEETLQYGNYKKVFETWDICDYANIETFESFCCFWHRLYERWGTCYGIDSELHEPGFPPKEDMYKYWYKSYKMK